MRVLAQAGQPLAGKEWRQLQVWGTGRSAGPSAGTGPSVATSPGTSQDPRPTSVSP